jgi:hypothetical protein
MASMILGDNGMHREKRRSSALFRNFDEAYVVKENKFEHGRAEYVS